MKIVNITSPNFMAGKVHVFSDFDGTYMPTHCSELSTFKPESLDTYCRETKDFLDKTNGDLSFSITTGRRYSSFERALEQLKASDTNLPLPEILITGNGKELRSRTGGNLDFYETGIIPYNENPEQAKATRKVEWKKMYSDGRELNKLYDTKKSLASAIQNKDLVITMGDGSNDFDMVNPLNYVDLKKYKEKSQNKEFFSQRMHKKLEDIKAIYNGVDSEYINNLRKEFTKNGLLKEIEELPLYAIVIKSNDKNDLYPIAEAFESTGKVITMERGNWSKTIQELIKKYAEKTDEFKKGMSEKFSEYIFGKNTNESDLTASTPKSSSVLKIFGISATAALVLGLGYYFTRKAKQEEKSETVNSQTLVA